MCDLDSLKTHRRSMAILLCCRISSSSRLDIGNMGGNQLSQEECPLVSLIHVILFARSSIPHFLHILSYL